ncbi:MAG TPA: septum formation initiator family protein [Candidatus Paceibacterota bacterium]
MFDFHERRKLRRYLYSPGVLLVLLVLVVFLARGVWHVYDKERETGLITAQKQAILDELKSREASLTAELDRLKTVRGIEQELREKYEVAKEGEKVIVLVEPPKVAAAVAEEGGFWHWLKNLFK